MLFVLDDPIVAKEDDKAISGKFPGSPTLSCLPKEKATNAMVMFAENAAEGLPPAGFEVLERVARLLGHRGGDIFVAK